jgi:glutamate-1-semialdehyde 2,1-aminomutase
MNGSIDDVIENILARKLDKQEAIKYFDAFSAEEQSELLTKLNNEVLSDDGDSERAPAGQAQQAVAVPMLTPVLEHSLSEQHLEYIKDLAEAFGTFAPKSKTNAIQSQHFFVDQRKTGGLKKLLKAMQYHITYDRGEGAYLYDVDGNKYVDITGDNGVNLFGHQPEFVKDAIIARLNKGYPLVGYTEELFKAAKLFCDITQQERVLFTQSGTEAVMWACRIARAATRKKKIVIFDGAYHGLSDTVLAFKGPNGISMSGGLGTLQEFADQLIVLDYGDMDQLRDIERCADEVAAVLVEPVQSRDPAKQPVAYLKELRKLTLEQNIVLIFDEMITGFRTCPRGVQGLFHVKADISTYGKVPGGGMPTGMIAGLAKYMDYVDGGTWNLDDDSMPSLKRTLMAGTHTRNPLKIAATLATLEQIDRRCHGETDCTTCNCFQKELSRKTDHLADSLNRFFTEQRVPIRIVHFRSLFRLKFLEDANGIVKELVFVLMRMNGVETSVSGNFFLNIEHTDEDIAAVVEAVKKSINTLLAKGFYREPDAAEVVEPDVPTTKEHGPPPAPKTMTSDPDSTQVARLKAMIFADLQGALEQEGR